MTANNRREIAIVDTTVADYQTLVDAAEAQGMEVIMISKGMAELAQKLEENEGIDALHILSHGSEGAVHLSGDTLNSDTLSDYTDALVVIQRSLTEDGDILLYGCDVAADQSGLDFIGKLAQVTGADVAASEDLSGAESLGGDWELEIANGFMEALPLFSTRIHHAYDSLLAISTGQVTFDGWNIIEQSASNSDFSLLGNDGNQNKQIGLGTLDGRQVAYINNGDVDHTDAFFGVQLIDTNQSFELTGAQLTELYSSSDFTDLFIIGEKAGGGTITSSSLNGSLSTKDTFTFDSNNLQNFNGVALTGFKVYFDTTKELFDIIFHNFSIAPIASNIPPTISNAPSDITVIEDTASSLDLSDVTFSDADAGDSLTVTLTASAGVFSTPADGAGSGSGVTETLLDDTSITLVGSAADINTYLDASSNIQS
ncbi:DUF4347 domain-containing protein [Vreelandella massiliensis]|uniref:DUF4347 domain-containing protein n=1 Tax=Vreelandella massiliensis TaxID=1816686 RepID=UPI00096A3C54|nr:DUF4347 domain-containing protein [Halomonas massiliensis]